MKYIILLISLTFFCLLTFGQLSEEDKTEIETLKITIETANHDSDVVNAYKDWDNLIFRSDPKLDLEINQKIEKVCEKNLTHDLNDREKTFFKSSISNAFNNLGISYTDFGDYATSLKYYSKGIEIAKELNDKELEANFLNNLGNIYGDLGELEKSIDFYEQSFAIREEFGDERKKTISYVNIGSVYSEIGDNERAMSYFLKSLEIDRKYEDNEGIAIALGNIGDIYLDKGQFKKALDYYYEALENQKKIKKIEGICSMTNNISRVLLKQKKYKEAIELSKKNLTRAKKMGGIFEMEDATYILYQSFQKIGDFENALKMHEQYTILEDSIGSENNKKEMLRHELKSTYEQQKSLDDAENDKLIAIEQEAKKKQTIITIATIFILMLVIFFLFFVFNRLRITKKQKFIIEEQKNIVDEKNKEITDSINYAKRIQNAILPPAKIVKEYLQDSFILYKPKDIVAGDFYWLEQKEHKVLFAAADCTGHGVPGAMLSVVCNNALNRSVREYNLTEPGEILDKTREIVIKEFEKSDEDVKDGMDIALCSLEGNTLKYAGANNPLWIIRNNELIDIKSNKQPIGKFYNPLPYTTHTINLEKGDSIYIFSDGYVDQFGGKKGKKFKAKTFKELLLSIQDKSMEDQKSTIDQTFETWRGNLEQIDDVCIIGVRL